MNELCIKCQQKLTEIGVLTKDTYSRVLFMCENKSCERHGVVVAWCHYGDFEAIKKENEYSKELEWILGNADKEDAKKDGFGDFYDWQQWKIEYIISTAIVREKGIFLRELKNWNLEIEHMIKLL